MTETERESAAGIVPGWPRRLALLLGGILGRDPRGLAPGDRVQHKASGGRGRVALRAPLADGTGRPGAYVEWDDGDRYWTMVYQLEPVAVQRPKWPPFH